MKKLILVCGANGVGKSTACKALTKKLPKSAFIDSDYCRYMNPFSFTNEEINIVVSNISTMMINYFRCSSIENIIFQYGFHGVRKQIFASILNKITQNGIEYLFCPIILFCELEENIRRMRNDYRDEERIQRAIEKTRSIYGEHDYPKIDTTLLSAEDTAERMVDVITREYCIV